GVGDGLVGAADLGSQGLGLDEACCVVGCPVDPETRGQLLQGFREGGRRGVQVAVRVVRRNVLVDAHDGGTSLYVRGSGCAEASASTRHPCRLVGALSAGRSGAKALRRKTVGKWPLSSRLRPTCRATGAVRRTLGSAVRGLWKGWRRRAS